MGATDPKVQRWALILGASSGIGEATARLAAEDGYNICGVYLGRSRGEKLDAAIAAVKATGVEALYIRGNAADDEKRAEVIAQLSERFAAARAADASRSSRPTLSAQLARSSASSAAVAVPPPLGPSRTTGLGVATGAELRRACIVEM